MNKKNLLIAAVVIVISGTGFAAYQQISAKKALAKTPATETTVVQRGDLSITVEATGSLAPQGEFSLAFPVGGGIYEIAVVEGQTVKQGDILASLEDSIQAKADFQTLFSVAGIAQAELARINAQSALDYAVGDLAYLIGPDAYYWEKQLGQAEERLVALNQDPNAIAEQKSAAEEKV